MNFLRNYLLDFFSKNYLGNIFRFYKNESFTNVIIFFFFGKYCRDCLQRFLQKFVQDFSKSPSDVNSEISPGFTLEIPTEIPSEILVEILGEYLKLPLGFSSQIYTGTSFRDVKKTIFHKRLNFFFF